jgi:heat shock protein HslJ
MTTINIKSYTLIVLFLFCSSLVSFNCYYSESVAEPIVGNWVLTQFYPAKKDTFKFKELVIFQIENAGMTVGFMGCNKFRTECKIQRDSIHFGTILSSRKFCGKAYMDLEDKLKSTLSSTNAYVIKENTLILFEGKKKLASFKKQ